MASPQASAKLRKSCDLCAATKVGCTKEKPRCARCAKRDQPCVYGTAKRAGRTSGKTQTSAQRDSVLTTTTTVSPSPTFTSPRTADVTDPSRSGSAALSPQLGSQIQCLQYPDNICRPSQPALDENCPSLAPVISFPELDELLASTTAFPPDHHQGDGAALFDFSFEDVTLPASPTFAGLPHLSTSPLSIGVPTPGSCKCLSHALCLLGGLTPGKPGSSVSQLPDFEQVLAQNEQASETVRAILQCSCSSDGYLLITLSLVVFRIIAWYTAATGAATGEDPPEPVLQGPPLTDGECECEQRIAVQCILSKLSGVQASINLLSQRLHRISETAEEKSCPGLSWLDKNTSPGGGMHAFLKPFSSGLANILETDLRRRLCELSKAILERLRRR
ncbi:hypothetical protein MaudCBS49596_002767 [Microsporum audouinii]